ncbi:MAG TPA: N-6 DNA methylase [Bacteroidia bacterium]|nr:N-6 DNA methylase [Bacteroidia bacterium]
MKSKIKNKSTSISDSFDVSSHKTEWTCAAKLAGWINEIAKEKNIPIGVAEVETKTADSGKRSDIIIYETPKNINALCVIECKLPFWDVFNEELKEDARNKGNKRKAPYFATTNFKKLIWWNTERANNPVLTEEQQILEKYFLSEIENLDEIENVRYREPIRRELEKFISKLFAVHTGKEPEPKQAIDEHLIDRIHEKIRVLAYFYTDIIRDKFHKDTKFARLLRNWFDEQMWDFTAGKNDFDKAARQTAYLLVNKILFYDVLQSKRPKELDPLKIPDSLTKGSMLQKTLQMYFDEVLKIDYETVYTTDFIDSIAFPDDDDLVKQIKELVSVLNRYNFGTLGYDILGRIFERLIPQNERHTLGQYFTSADVVDLILRFCTQNEDDKILDPSCGAGTFLVRGYQHKKLMNQQKKHEEILDKLWGNDIAKFPAHLSTINLAINDLGVLKNYPNILQSDFFALQVGPHGFDNDNWRKRRAKTLGVDEREVTYPRYFDAIVGNPPYTRQEEISDTGVDKHKLIAKAVMFGNKKIADISEQAGIHAYFFVHGWKFLKEGGHFGFIVSNSWLDVDFGKGLQEFFLRNYKIIAIIDSEVERWFTDADVNTCIVILEKCNDEKKRMENLARFVLLKKPLRNFIPAADNEWSKQVNRKDEIDKLINTILAHSKYYENDSLRVFPISQKELWEEGFDIISPEEDNNIQNKVEEPGTFYGKYLGAKWGKYLRAPEIFFKALERNKGRLVPLKKLGDVKAGCYTGINEFFYFDKRPAFKDKVEKEFLKKIIRNTREVNSININSEKIDSKVFVCQASKKELAKTKKHGASSYIKWGEKQIGRKRQKRKTEILFPHIESVKNRKPGWWAIPEQNIVAANLFMLYVINKRFITPYSEIAVVSDRCFHRIFPFEKDSVEILAAILNSTFTIFSIELYGRSNLGLGALKFEATDAKKIFVINCNIVSQKIRNKIIASFSKIKERIIEDIFEELGATKPSEVYLNKIKPDRRELDKIIMGEILGLSDEEQLEVYRSVVHLVKQRIEKAKSVEKKNKFADGIDIKMAKKDLVKEIENRSKE